MDPWLILIAGVVAAIVLGSLLLRLGPRHRANEALRLLEPAFVAGTLVVALLAGALAWDALSVAKDQLTRANRLTAASMQMSQWLSYVEACDAAARDLQSDDVPAVAYGMWWQTWDRESATEAMDRAAARVAEGKADAVADEFDRWRVESGCPLVGPLFPWGP